MFFNVIHDKQRVVVRFKVFDFDKFNAVFSFVFFFEFSDFVEKPLSRNFSDFDRLDFVKSQRAVDRHRMIARFVDDNALFRSDRFEQKILNGNVVGKEFVEKNVFTLVCSEFIEEPIRREAKPGVENFEDSTRRLLYVLRVFDVLRHESVFVDPASNFNVPRDESSGVVSRIVFAFCELDVAVVGDLFCLNLVDFNEETLRRRFSNVERVDVEVYLVVDRYGTTGSFADNDAPV